MNQHLLTDQNSCGIRVLSDISIETPYRCVKAIMKSVIYAVFGSNQVGCVTCKLEGLCVWKDERSDIVLFTQ